MMMSIKKEIEEKRLSKMTYSEFAELNTEVHLSSNRNKCIAIRDIIKMSGDIKGYIVVYDDYAAMSRDRATMKEIVSWVKSGIKYIDNPMILYEYIEKEKRNDLDKIRLNKRGIEKSENERVMRLGGYIVSIRNKSDHSENVSEYDNKEKEIVISDVYNVITRERVAKQLVFNLSKTWAMNSKKLFVGNTVMFDVTVVGDLYLRPRNICGRQVLYRSDLHNYRVSKYAQFEIPSHCEGCKYNKDNEKRFCLKK